MIVLFLNTLFFTLKAASCHSTDRFSKPQALQTDHHSSLLRLVQQLSWQLLTKLFAAPPLYAVTWARCALWYTLRYVSWAQCFS